MEICLSLLHLPQLRVNQAAAAVYVFDAALQKGDLDLDELLRLEQFVLLILQCHICAEQAHF